MKNCTVATAIHSDFNFAVHIRKKERGRIVSTLRVNNVPREYEAGGRADERKVTVHFSSALFRTRRCPESLSVSLVLPLFNARVHDCVPPVIQRFELRYEYIQPTRLPTKTQVY